MRKFFYHSIGVLGWVSSGIGAVLGYSSHYPKPAHRAILDAIFAMLLSHAGLTALFVAFGSGALVIQKQMRQPWIKPAVKKMLDAMRQDAFTASNALAHHHRVTLFRVRRFCWKAIWDWRSPFGIWLVPFSRSGPAEKMNAYFLIPPDLDKAEGIAGMAYSTDSTVQVEDLPNVGGKSPKLQDLQMYAKKAYVDIEWLKKKQPKSRSLLGFPVKVKGKTWGVLVLDSRDRRIPERERVDKSLQLCSRFLTELLERS